MQAETAHPGITVSRRVAGAIVTLFLVVAGLAVWGWVVALDDDGTASLPDEPSALALPGATLDLPTANGTVRLVLVNAWGGRGDTNAVLTAAGGPASPGATLDGLGELQYVLDDGTLLTPLVADEPQGFHFWAGQGIPDGREVTHLLFTANDGSTARFVLP